MKEDFAVSKEIPDGKDKAFIEEYQRKNVSRSACFGTLSDAVHNAKDILSWAAARRMVIFDSRTAIVGKSSV